MKAGRESPFYVSHPGLRQALAAWLAGKGELKAESRAYVAFVTGRELEEWRRDPVASPLPVVSDVPARASVEGEPTCLRQVADLRTTAPVMRVASASSRPIAAVAVVRAANPMARASQPRPVALAQVERQTPMARLSARRIALAPAPNARAAPRPASAARPTTRVALDQVAAMPWQSLAQRRSDAVRIAEPRRIRLSRDRAALRPRIVRLARAGGRGRFAASQPGRRGFHRRRSRV